MNKQFLNNVFDKQTCSDRFKSHFYFTDWAVGGTIRNRVVNASLAKQVSTFTLLWIVQNIQTKSTNVVINRTDKPIFREATW
jgi:hypothetical protein